MIYSKSTYNRIIAFFLAFAGLVFIVLSMLAIVEYRQSEARMKRDILLLFKEAINEEVKLKMDGELVFIHRTNDLFVKKKTIKNQTIITADVAVTKEAEISGDMDAEFLKTSQTYLLGQNRLQPDTLQQVFDSKLAEAGIKVRSIILVHHERSLTMDVSGDTTPYRIRHRMPVVEGGAFGEIAYEVLLDYSPLAVIRLMPKSVMVVLFTLGILMLGVIIYLFVEKRKNKPYKIMKRGRYYYIGETVFDTRKNELIGQKREVIPVTRKYAEILLMFLKSDDHAVEKSVLKETLWPDKPYTANQSLMSTINKLRNCLKEADCAFSISTKKGDDYYILKYLQEDTEPDMLTLISSSSPSAVAGK